MTLPAAFTMGTRSITTRGFASYNEDMTLSKMLYIKERFRAELRWEAFNTLNRVWEASDKRERVELARSYGKRAAPDGGSKIIIEE
jgi:hypothetical protein